MLDEWHWGSCVRWLRWFSGYLLSPSGRNLLFLAAQFSLLLPVLVVARKTLCWSNSSCCAGRKLPPLFPNVSAVGLMGVPGETQRAEEHRVFLAVAKRSLGTHQLMLFQL